MFILEAGKLPIFAAIYALFIGTLAHATTLELITSVPTNNAVDVSRTDILTLQFSVSLSAKSVNTDTVTLQSITGTQKVSLSISGAVISVKLSTPLLPWTRYTLNAASLSGSNGEQLAAPVSISFKTRDATWQAPQQIYNVPLGQWDPASATNANGIRFIVWLQVNDPGVGYDVWATRQVPGQSPTDATLVASFPNNYVSELNVFVDDDGNAFATWVTNSPPLPGHIWVNRFSAGSGWGSGWGVPQIINGNSTRTGSNLHLVFDHAGNALALWQEHTCCTDPSLQIIVANRYTQLSGWSKPVHLDDSYSLLWGKIDIQVDNAGNAYASWSMLENVNLPTPRLVVSRYSLNVGWSAPQIIATESTSHTDGYQALAVNPRGEAFLMWADDDGLRFARADNFGNWSSPIFIDSTITISPTQMVLLNNGEAFAAFVSGVMNYMPDQGWWSSIHRLQTDQSLMDPTLIGDPQIIADISGNAVVAFTQVINHTARIFAKRYRSNWGWLSSVFLDIDNTWGGAELQTLSPAPGGNAVVTWLQGHGDGSLDIEAARFE